MVRNVLSVNLGMATDRQRIVLTFVFLHLIGDANNGPLGRDPVSLFVPCFLDAKAVDFLRGQWSWDGPAAARSELPFS